MTVSSEKYLDAAFSRNVPPAESTDEEQTGRQKQKEIKDCTYYMSIPLVSHKMYDPSRREKSLNTNVITCTDEKRPLSPKKTEQRQITVLLRFPL